MYCLGLGTSEWRIHDLELAFRRQLLDGEALKETHPQWTPTLMTGQALAQSDLGLDNTDESEVVAPDWRRYAGLATWHMS